MADWYKERNAPGAPLDWRWQEGLRLAKGGMSRHGADAAVRAAQRFWHWWNACQSPADEQRLAARMPALYQALTIEQEPGGQMKAAVQARLLAREGATRIAQKTATRPEVIQAFAQLFFDVKNRLDSRDYILLQVIGPAPHPAPGEARARLWKLFGYLGGSAVLDAVLAGGTTGQGNAAEVAALLAEDTRVALQVQIAVAARSLRASEPRAAQELARLSLSLSARAAAAERGLKENIMEQHIGALMDEIFWLRGTDENPDLPAAVATWDESAVELRDEQLILLSAGETPPGLDVLEELRQRPPRPPRPRQGSEPGRPPNGPKPMADPRSPG